MQAFDLLACLQDLIPFAVPGLLFAILSLPGFLFFSVWLCMQCGVRPPSRQAFIIGSSKQVQAGGG